MNIIIRQATTSDARDIANINKFEMGYDYPVKSTEIKLVLLLNSTQDKIFVAESNHQVVGYIHANDYDTLYFDHYKNIMGIAVLNEFQHKGIGQMLMSAVEKWAKETDAVGIRLVSGKSRTIAHEFYRKCGFTDGKEQFNFKKHFNEGSL